MRDQSRECRPSGLPPLQGISHSHRTPALRRSVARTHRSRARQRGTSLMTRPNSGANSGRRKSVARGRVEEGGRRRQMVERRGGRGRREEEEIGREGEVRVRVRMLVRARVRVRVRVRVRMRVRVRVGLDMDIVHLLRPGEAVIFGDTAHAMPRDRLLLLHACTAQRTTRLSGEIDGGDGE